jgi:hypothetical protein
MTTTKREQWCLTTHRDGNHVSMGELINTLAEHVRHDVKHHRNPDGSVPAEVYEDLLAGVRDLIAGYAEHLRFEGENEILRGQSLVGAAEILEEGELRTLSHALSTVTHQRHDREMQDKLERHDAREALRVRLERGGRSGMPEPFGHRERKGCAVWHLTRRPCIATGG